MGQTEKFVIKHRALEDKEESSVIMTLRLEKELQQEYDNLAKKSDRSRNELMNLALRYAIKNLEFYDK